MCCCCYSWIRRIGAHGILADDMGLGKTLQALMAVAMCHHSHARQPGEKQSGDDDDDISLRATLKTPNQHPLIV